MELYEISPLLRSIHKFELRLETVLIALQNICTIFLVQIERRLLKHINEEEFISLSGHKNMVLSWKLT